jgi:predicted HNH restriction endonuclease
VDDIGGKNAHGKNGEVNDLTIHHLDGKGRHNAERGLEVNNSSNNLIVLCRKCHGSIHGKERGKNKMR